MSYLFVYSFIHLFFVPQILSAEVNLLNSGYIALKMLGMKVHKENYKERNKQTNKKM